MAEPGATDVSSTYLGGLRVVEIADEQGEYCGRILANLGADVIKVEPPGGAPTRKIGPFYGDGNDPNESLYFWHYNLGKRSIELDLDTEAGQLTFRELVATADVVLDSSPIGYLDGRGIGYDQLSADHPALILASITPFGRTGPWADYQGSDLVHLALGGQMMYCGYDQDINGEYDTPPIAPQMWQAYHMAADHAAIGILGAVLCRELTGVGQRVDVSVHQVVSTNTELDVPRWIYNRLPTQRSTTPHSQTKDGRFLYALWGYPGDGHKRVAHLLEPYGLADDLADEKYDDPAYRFQPDAYSHIEAVVDRYVGKYKYPGPWLEAQAAGLVWAPMRRPEENLSDPHWAERQTFADVEHPDLGRSFKYAVGRWYSDDADWKAGPPAPSIGEHSDDIRAELSAASDSSRGE